MATERFGVNWAALQTSPQVTRQETASYIYMALALNTRETLAGGVAN